MSIVQLNDYRTRVRPQLLQESPTKRKAHTSRFERGDPDYWRRGARAIGVDTGTCTKCLGKGWVAVSDGTGCIDFDECQRCRTDRPRSHSLIDDVSAF